MALLVVLLVLAAPGVAEAATVEVRYGVCNDSYDCQMDLLFTAAPGEANDVTLRFSPEELRVTDAGAPLVVGGGCRSIGAHDAVCPDLIPDVELGDGDDRAQLLGELYLAEVDAGPGDDVVIGGGGTDELTAGPGADTLLGGSGNDDLFDGVRVRYEADVFDGGEGRDDVSWEGRRSRVAADLSSGALAGSPGEGDRVVGIESLAGGAGDDRLRGDAGHNRLVGGAGADRLDAGAGNDSLAGGPGDDVVRGGDGDDDINSVGLRTLPGNPDPGGSDRLLCGDAHDRADEVQAGDRVADDCERVFPSGTALGFDQLLPLPSLDAPVMRMRVYHCLGERACRFEMTVRSGDRILGRRGGRARYGARRLPLRLSRRGRRILRREGRLGATLEFRDDDAQRGSWRVVLRAPIRVR